MMGLNPGLNFNPGDVGNTPFNPEPDGIEEVNQLVELCIQERKDQFLLEDKGVEFDPASFVDLYTKQSYFEDMRVANVEVANDIISNLVFDQYQISEKTRDQIRSNMSPDLTEYPYIRAGGQGLPPVLADYVETKEDEEKISECRSYLEENKEKGLLEIAKELEISPHTVAKVRYDSGLYPDERKQNNAGRILSTLLGYHFGRFGDTSESSEILDISQISSSDWSVLADVGDAVFGNYDHVQKEIEALTNREIRNWISDRYFRYNHCKQYKRRGQCNPIYWQLESPGGAFSCFIYYHSIDVNTLPKLRGQYLDPRIGELENELETLTAQTSGDNPDKELLNRKEEVQNDLDDIREFRDTIDEMIDDGVTVDIEKGIWENIREWDQYEVLETGLPKLKSSYSR
jgi:hypothetical protein